MRYIQGLKGIWRAWEGVGGSFEVESSQVGWVWVWVGLCEGKMPVLNRGSMEESRRMWFD
jgi:hypothetical protein